MDTVQSHWAPQLRANGPGDPSSASRRIKASPTRPLSFLDLPRELRDVIYTHLVPDSLSFTMPNQHRQETYWFKGGLHVRTFPKDCYLATNPVLFLSHQIRREMLDCIYAHTTFRFDWRRRASFILRVLHSVPAAAKSHIRHLSWTEWSLHTGGERRSYTGWAKVMGYIATEFPSLRTAQCSFPSGENGSHHFHNWEVPRLAATLLAGGRIEQLTWCWCIDGFSYNTRRYVDVGSLVALALRLLSIPYDEERDWDKGFEFRRLMKSEDELDESDAFDRWAMECLARPKHQFTATVDARSLVLTSS